MASESLSRNLYRSFRKERIRGDRDLLPLEMGLRTAVACKSGSRWPIVSSQSIPQHTNQSAAFLRVSRRVKERGFVTSIEAANHHPQLL